MDFDLKLDKKAEKGCILNSRILWFFSEAAMLTGRADLVEDARHAYQFFLKNCYDEANGGVYWSCDYTGKPQGDPVQRGSGELGRRLCGHGFPRE